MNTKTPPSHRRPDSGATFRLAFGRVRTLFLALALLAALGIATTVRADRVGHDVSAGFLQVDQYPGNGFDDNTNCIVSLPISVNGLSTPSWNRGDYRVQIGGSIVNNTNNGVLLAAVAQNGRNNWNNYTPVTNQMQTCGVQSYVDGAWEVVSWRCPINASQTANPGEDNVNVGAAYFPYSTWFGGAALNSANGAILDSFTGSPGLVLGTHFIDAKTTNGPGGVAYLSLLSFGIDSRRDGVLLVNSAKNEANYALSRAETNGTWTIWSHDNRNDGRNYEQDPLCFVFVPKTNTAVVSGRFMADATIDAFSGTSPQFTVTNIATGRWLLRIPGRSSTNGVLIISPEGGQPFNGDNIVTCEPSGDGWEIQSRDIPGMGLQSPTGEPVASFVYIPAELPGITATPTKNLLTTEAGGTAQFTVKLSGYPKPTANVTINLSSSDTTEGTISTSTLTFTPADWNVPQTVTVTGVDDALADGMQFYTINLSAATSTDPNYNGLVSGNVSVGNIDDEPGASFDVGSVTTSEAGTTATFNAWLNTAPTGDVTLTLSSSDTTEATVSPTTLTFTPANYATPQPVTVTGVDDLVADGNIAYSIVTAPLVSADPIYNGSDPADVAGVNIDNDAAGFVIPPDPLTVSEPNSTATFTVVLTSQPTANVTVNCVSSDLTEATVTPSVTFTTADWNTPKTVTVTAADDLINDGPIAFTIITSVTSSDPVYAAINPADVSVTTLDNEPVLTLPFGDINYGLGEPPTVVDGWAKIVDPDTTIYNGGSLVISLTSGATSNDRLAVRNAGTGTGQVGVAGASVSFEGTAVGSTSGGTGTTPLTITLNSAASLTAAQAVLRAVTYQNVSADAPASARTVSVTLADGLGGTASASKAITLRQVRDYSFQQGLDIGFGPYLWAGDDQIHQDFPDTAYPTGYSVSSGMWIDWVNASLLGQPQVLLQFTNIVGNAAGQIPAGARIVSAELILDLNDSGQGMKLNRMLGGWEPDSATFNTFGGDGITLDDVEAMSGTNAFLCDQVGSTTVPVGFASIGVTRDVQAWVNGTNNYGWVMSPWARINNGNGTGFSPCEAANLPDRPRLRVEWLPPTVSMASFCQGVDGYTGAVDTQIRLSGPDTDFSTATGLAPDAAVTNTPPPNAQQVLIRFDGLIGSVAGQVPAGSSILAAVLELTSVTSDSQGDGGEFHALLKPWNATDTWNIWVDGITNDGVEAAIAATALIGNPDVTQPPLQPTMHTVNLTADVQAWASGLRQNYGWAILPYTNGNDGWGISSSDIDNPSFRPQLRVFYEPGVTLLTPVHNGGNVLIKFTGVIGRTYTVLRSAVPGPTWTSRGTATVGVDGTATLTDNSPLPGAAYYRVSYP